MMRVEPPPGEVPVTFDVSRRAVFIKGRVIIAIPERHAE
jgi:hypothetical protein